MNTPGPPFSDAVTDQEILASFKALPTEDELPCDDGEPVETARHRDQMIMLIESLKAHWSDRKGYYVGGNMFMYYDPDNKARFRGPDFFLVLDVEDRERKSWVVWREGMRFPDVIIELLSESMHEVDRGEKESSMSGPFAPQSTTCLTRSVTNSGGTICGGRAMPRWSLMRKGRSPPRRPACIWRWERAGYGG